MTSFNVSKPWVLLVPPGIPAVQTAAEEMARCIGTLRGPGRKAPPLQDASAAAPGEETPVILLNRGGDEAERGGFTWRAGGDRVEIYGDSGRGLCGGIYDFLSALGIRWPRTGREELPSFRAGGEYRLSEDRNRVASRGGAAELRRLVLSASDILRRGEALVRWAARNRIDALVFPLGEAAPFPARLFGLFRGAIHETLRAAADRGLIIEAGGRDLPLLVPRRYFFIRRELFRMEGGTRRRNGNFCPSNPDTIRLLKQEAEKRFRSRPEAVVFHLWPDCGGEKAWCSCPACRAFSPAEQNRIAVNAAADALSLVNPAARAAFYEKPGEEGAGIHLRPNLFALEKLPDGY